MYRIPKDASIIKTIREVLDGHKEVGSQEEFWRMVEAMVRKADSSYRVSPSRLRRLAAVMGDVVIRVVKMRTSKRAKSCYVCGGEMRQVKMKDLFGKESVGGRRCTRCGFELERDDLAPRRYIFIRR